MEFQVHKKEKRFFTFMLLVSFLLYTIFLGAAFKGKVGLIILIYVALFFILNLLLSILLIGHIKGNAIRINAKQFPDVFEILKNHCALLNLSKVPDMYLLQGNGVLNAFATRFSGRNFVILYSTVLEAAYQEGSDAVSFIIGHELGHIKRNHVGFLKTLLIWPAKMVPFLSSAYSRACEYTCDNIGYHLCPKGAVKGMLILAAGKRLYAKINIEEAVSNFQSESGFMTSFAEAFSTHPAIIKRISVLNQLSRDNLIYDSMFVSPKVNLKGDRAQL